MTKLTGSDPSQIGPYDVVERLGAGASGVVYKATDSTGRVVAVKVLRPEIADQPQVRQRLAREADALQKVEGSRTVRVIEVDPEGERPYLAMEFVPGESLEEFITQNGPMKGANLWGLVEALIEALQSLEKAGVVHRDLKPSNVLIGPDGIKIVDFGISSLGESSGLTETGVVLGTASWLSPEQISGRAVGSASDVFNLGLNIAYAATGRHPFGEGRSDALMYRVAHSEPDLNGLSNAIAQIVVACLRKNPTERPGLEALSTAISGLPSGERESDSAGEHLAESIPKTRIVSPILELPINNSAATSYIQTKPNENGPEKSKKKLLLSIGGITFVIALLTTGLIIGNSYRENVKAERLAYEEQFKKILNAVDRLETSNETYLDSMNGIEKVFFEFDWEKNGYRSFTDFVRIAGPKFWIAEYGKVYLKFYESLNPELTNFRATAFPNIERKSDLISIKNAFTDHYDVWLDYADKYSAALDAYTTDLNKSWEKTSLIYHEALNRQISETFKTACNLLGDFQPVGEDVDFSRRIAKICED